MSGHDEHAQRMAALRDLEAAGYVRPMPSLLDFDYRQCDRLWKQGNAFGYVVMLLNIPWASRPDMSLGDLLKTRPRWMAEEVARKLAAAGLHDPGLDDLLLPDPDVTALWPDDDTTEETDR